MTQSKTVAIQMDPIEDIDISADSSFVLALEGQTRGYQLYHYQPMDLALFNGLVTARARALTLRPEPGNHFSFGLPEIIDLGEIDVVLMRCSRPCSRT